MHLVIDTLLARPFLTLGVGAFLSGAALLYLVMQRTRKHRIEKARRADG